MYHSNKMTHNNILLCRKRERFENTQVYTGMCLLNPSSPRSEDGVEGERERVFRDITSPDKKLNIKKKKAF